jgi:hypothetical protein
MQRSAAAVPGATSAARTMIAENEITKTPVIAIAVRRA